MRAAIISILLLLLLAAIIWYVVERAGSVTLKPTSCECGAVTGSDYCPECMTFGKDGHRDMSPLPTVCAFAASVALVVAIFL